MSEAVEKKDRSAAASAVVPRLFFLEANAGRIPSRDRGRPWDWGKAFDQLAPVAPLHCINGGWHPGAGRIWLAVTGVEAGCGPS
jgi:2-keto-4-pentenoate hydratase/2-oxohepta-3-ene-1,7-dioic acid hydratase in catechol pathway